MKLYPDPLRTLAAQRPSVTHRGLAISQIVWNIQSKCSIKITGFHNQIAALALMKYYQYDGRSYTINQLYFFYSDITNLPIKMLKIGLYLYLH